MDNTLTIQTERLLGAVDLQEQLLASLPLLDEAHYVSKKEAFAHNMPCYTCIDNENHWIKELENGDKFLVKRIYNWEKSEPVENIIKKLD